MATGLDLLPLDSDEASVMERAGEAWDFSGPLPMPKWDVRCEQCCTGNVQLRQWIFHKWKRERTPYRCDVHFKCRWCGKVWVHGLVISQELFERHSKDGANVRYGWRDARYAMRYDEADLSADKPEEHRLRRLLEVKV